MQKILKEDIVRNKKKQSQESLDGTQGLQGVGGIRSDEDRIRSSFNPVASRGLPSQPVRVSEFNDINGLVGKTICLTSDDQATSSNSSGDRSSLIFAHNRSQSARSSGLKRANLTAFSFVLSCLFVTSVFVVIQPIAMA